jgi:hypothetical protein
VDTRQRHRNPEELLIKQQALGRHVEWTERLLQRTILIVSEPFREPERVLIAFDGSKTTARLH